MRNAAHSWYYTGVWKQKCFRSYPLHIFGQWLLSFISALLSFFASPLPSSPPFSSLCSPILSSSLLLPAIRSLKLTLSVLLKHSLLYWLVAGPLAEPGVHSFQLVCLASVFQLYVPCAVMPAWLLCGFWSSELHYSYLHSKCFIKP